jgi:hypothetical protein
MTDLEFEMYARLLVEATFRDSTPPNRDRCVELALVASAASDAIAFVHGPVAPVTTPEQSN